MLQLSLRELVRHGRPLAEDSSGSLDLLLEQLGLGCRHSVIEAAVYLCLI